LGKDRHGEPPHHLTAIEENNTWIVVFGFNMGAAGTVSSHGKKTDHYRDLSRLTMLIFIGVSGLGDFSEEDISKLVNAVTEWARKSCYLIYLLHVLVQ
jgi:hypothetical protein